MELTLFFYPIVLSAYLVCLMRKLNNVTSLPAQCMSPTRNPKQDLRPSQCETNMERHRTHSHTHTAIFQSHAAIFQSHTYGDIPVTYGNMQSAISHSDTRP